MLSYVSVFPISPRRPARLWSTHWPAAEIVPKGPGAVAVRQAERVAAAEQAAEQIVADTVRGQALPGPAVVAQVAVEHTAVEHTAVE